MPERLPEPPRLNPRERLSPEERQLFFLQNGVRYPDPSPARENLDAAERFVRDQPRHPEGWYFLGDNLFHDGATLGLPPAHAAARAVESFERAIAADSGFAPAYHHLPELLAGRDTTKLRRLMQHYFTRLEPDSRITSYIGWHTAVALGDVAALAAVRARLDSLLTADLDRIVSATQFYALPKQDAERALELLERRNGTTAERWAQALRRYAYALNAGRPAEVARMVARMRELRPASPEYLVWQICGALRRWRFHVRGDRGRGAGEAGGEAALVRSGGAVAAAPRAVPARTLAPRTWRRLSRRPHAREAAPCAARGRARRARRRARARRAGRDAADPDRRAGRPARARRRGARRRRAAGPPRLAAAGGTRL